MNNAALVGILVLLTTAGCTQQSGDANFFREIQDWQSQRVSRLTSPKGWLTLVGLSWLKEGDNSCGSDPSNDVVFPEGKTPARIGTISRTGNLLSFRAESGVKVTLRDSTVSLLRMQSDENGKADPTILHIGSVSFYVIQRGDQLGVRIKDSLSTMRTTFRGLEYFPPDPRWRITARFEPYTPARLIRIPTTAGVMDDYTVTGALVFSHGNETYRIDAVQESDASNHLFLMFKDLTNEVETYGGGRQLYAALPDSAGNVILEFNKAYNWPCVFTEFAACPIPPRQNHLPFRVEAGEKMYHVETN